MQVWVKSGIYGLGGGFGHDARPPQKMLCGYLEDYYNSHGMPGMKSVSVFVAVSGKGKANVTDPSLVTANVVFPSLPHYTPDLYVNWASLVAVEQIDHVLCRSC